MIAKGTTHDNGGKLATYLVNGKPGERAELWQLRGFASDQIKEAFRSVHVMADATRCEQPLFHVQVRNPAGEHLARQQWERVADRIEGKLGLTDQPRAIAFHRDEETGDEHMHIGWSRIDEMTMTAKALPFFKLRLKEVSRELETELGLTPVRSERAGVVMAPKRDEDEQARRLGVDIRDVRSTIRECWERSDNGHSFVAALASQNLVLAKGDKRDFMAVDHQGGMHALGKRILGSTAGEVRARMSDLDRERLPTVEQARDQLPVRRELVAEMTITPGEDAAAKDGMAKAARENTIRKTPEPQSAILAQPEREGDRTAAEIGIAFRSSRNASEFTAAIGHSGIRLAVVTAAEAKQQDTYRVGEFVAVNQSGQVYRLEESAVGLSPVETRVFLASLDHRELCGIEATQEQIYLEALLHIELSQIGGLSARKADAPAERPEPPALRELPKDRPEWERMLFDRGYRRRIEQRDLERREQERIREDSNRRSRERDRF